MSNNTVSTRLSEKNKHELRNICKNRGEDISDFVRRAIKKELASLGFLTIEEKKALGIQTKTHNQHEEVQI